MGFICYYLLVKPLSLLPFSVLYLISDTLYLLLYKLFRYRNKVVTGNLKNSFPDYTAKEIRQTKQAFYRHFCDLIVESIKLFSISQNEARKRFKVLNPEVLDQYAQSKRNLIIASGHYNNWEMLAQSVDLYIKHQSVGIYHRIANKFLDKKIYQSRSKFGMRLIPRQGVRDFFSKKHERTAIFFGIDQSPSIAKKVYWTRFLNQETAVMFGAEKFAVAHDLPVIFASTRKTKRGFYETTFEVLTEFPTQAQHGEITESHTKMLEKLILEAPQYWLWTHKRWKRKKASDETNKAA